VNILDSVLGRSADSSGHGFKGQLVLSTRRVHESTTRTRLIGKNNR
jgi:hypothetical protein